MPKRQDLTAEQFMTAMVEARDEFMSYANTLLDNHKGDLMATIDELDGWMAEQFDAEEMRLLATSLAYAGRRAGDSADATTYMPADDIVLAAADLAERSGCTEFKVYPDENRPPGMAWNIECAFGEKHRIAAYDQPSPEAAALAIAIRLLFRAMCKCGRPVSLCDDPGRSMAEGEPAPQEWCRWRLLGAHWVPGCDAEAILVKAGRGDPEAIRQAMDETLKRRQEEARHAS